MEPKYAGDTVSKRFYFRDEHDALIDPTAITATLYTPTGATQQTFTLSNFTDEGTGTFVLTFNVPAGAAVGEWRLIIVPTITTGTLQETEAFVFEVTSNQQPYGSLERVKRLCDLGTVTTRDQDVNDALIDADRFINTQLTAHSITVPLTVVAGILHTIAEYMAAGSYLQNASPDEKPHPYTLKGEKLLNDYIMQTYSSESPFYIGTDTS